MKLKTHNALLLGGALCFLPALVGCKPSEKNYKSAYEVALQKKERDKAAADPEEEGMIREGAPRRQQYNGEEIQTLSEHLLREGKEPVTTKVNVAVGLFKMPTNARSGAATFAAEGFPAFAAKSYGDRWFIILGGFDNMDEAVKLAARFKRKYPDYPYIGLDGAPAMVRNY